MQLLSDIHRLAQLGAAHFERLMGTLSAREAMVLDHISRYPQCSQEAIAKALCLEPATVAGIVRRLVDKKFITRKRCAVNYRRNELSTTAAGRSAVKIARVAAVQAEIQLRLGEPMAARLAERAP